MPQVPETKIVSHSITSDICVVSTWIETTTGIVNKIEADQFFSDRLKNMPRLDSLEIFLNYAAGHQTILIESIKVKYLISTWKARE